MVIKELTPGIAPACFDDVEDVGELGMVWEWSPRIPGHQLSRLKVRHTTVLGACEVVWGVQDSTCSEWHLRCSLVVRAGLRRVVLCFEPFEEWQCCGHCDSCGLRKDTCGPHVANKFIAGWSCQGCQGCRDATSTSMCQLIGTSLALLRIPQNSVVSHRENLFTRPCCTRMVANVCPTKCDNVSL